IGITSQMPALSGFPQHGVPAKPLGPFAARWEEYLNSDGPARVAVIGGGVAGAELAMAMAHALKAKKRQAQVHLIDSQKALSATPPGTRVKLLTAMEALGVTVLEHTDIDAASDDHVLLSNGETIASDFTTGAAGAFPYPWLAETGLDLHDGFISVDAWLRSSDPAVFAVGDCAHLSADPRPKAGVYAVREAPVLFDNLRAALSGNSLRPYKPQRDYLKLISLGEKSALADRFGICLSGPLMWHWKDHIDQKFMTRLRDLPEMAQLDLPRPRAEGMREALGDKPLCGGCGAKVGRGALRNMTTGLPTPVRNDVTPLPGDDAALLVTGSQRQVMTSDHLRSFTEDPVIMTRIAAVHALGDIWAMGAKPQAATATLILPRLSDALQARTLREIMTTATDVMRAAGAEIVGGHSSIGGELTIGFTLTGLCDSNPITLAGGKAGDALILTKPLGSGVLMAAEMAGKADGAWIAAAFEHMTQPQSRAAAILSGAHAMTDVTGFGLAGHLKGICEASGTGATLDLSAVPAMAGALEMVEAGIRSSIFADNRGVAPELPDGGKANLLFDPQTAGGLLASVPKDQASDLVDELRASGYPAARIGSLTKGAPQLSLSAG
ncbi:MAG: selenide, water dikinase SelD, partial [Litoreibacter sp.]|nr:selenide, water dikinase SelD [Litoreibacter sp.]